jgi:Uma2 family endonuclease
VEVRSPSTALIDLNRKKAAYERFGVESYWVVVPNLDKPEVIILELHDGRYQEAAHLTGEQAFAAAKPFCIEVVPSQLVAGLQPRVR